MALQVEAWIRSGPANSLVLGGAQALYLWPDGDLMPEEAHATDRIRPRFDMLNDGAALVLGPGGEIVAHRPSLPRPFLDNHPLLGREVQNLAPPALGACLHRLWRTCRASGRSASAELAMNIFPSQPAQAITLSFRVVPHPDGGRAWVVTIRDLTQERDRVRNLSHELDAVRAQRDEWESAARAAAHDVRSSLVAMTGFIKLALDPPSQVSPEASERLSRALESASRIRSITETILGREPEQDARHEHVHVALLSGRLFRALQAAHPEVPFTWCVDAGEEVAAVPSDALWEVLWNLLSNTVKYRNPEHALHVDLKAWRESAETWIELRDNGRGLVRGEEEAIFLYRRRGFRARGIEGSGLGLFSARRMIESCGGRVWAEPSQGGAVFRVAVPAWVTESPGPPESVGVRGSA